MEKIDVCREQQQTSICLSGDLGLNEAEALTKALGEAFAEGQNTRLDLQAVEGCHTAIVQVLLAASKSFKASNLTFNISAASDAFVELSAVAGVSHLLSVGE